MALKGTAGVGREGGTTTRQEYGKAGLDASNRLRRIERDNVLLDLFRKANLATSTVIIISCSV
jgi:hypothetical protein